MCGRFGVTTLPEEIAEYFELEEAPPVRPSWNITPQRPVLAVRTAQVLEDGASDAGRSGREWAALVWGLVPPWAKDPKIGAKMINARAETVAEKPSYRVAFRRRRCVVPADFYYEWKRPRGGAKQPYAFALRSGEPMGLAGIWEHWEDGKGSVLETVAIMTTEPNGLCAEVHDRMPVIIAKDHFGDWMKNGEETKGLGKLLRPYPAEEMKSWPVSTRVNNPRNDDNDLIERVELPGQGELF